MTSPYSVTVDQASITRAKKVLDKYRGKSLSERLGRGSLQAARMLVSPIRANTPIGPTRNLYRSIKARASRRGTIMGGLVGPTAPHRHLVIRPHRIVTPGGTDTGRKTTGNPFVDAAVEPRRDDVIREVAQILFGP